MTASSNPADFTHGDVEPVDGRYVWVEFEGEKHRTYFEKAGNGPVPLLCLHAAGADSRQFRHVLNDDSLHDGVTLYAFDMPWHGRSYPPLSSEWWTEEYRLTTDEYAGFIAKFADALDLDDPIVLGCSMGGSIALQLAHSYADRFRAVIGLEATPFAPSRDFPYFGHPRIDQEVMRPEWAYSFQAPQSPERFKRETWWIYSQTGHGVFEGDLYFYGNDWDARDWIEDIATEDCGVYLLTGEYDFSATPADSKSVAERIAGASFEELPQMGHFPMAENPDSFADHLHPVLDDILAE